MVSAAAARTFLVLETVDAVLEGRAVVAGSLPPEARDVDLVVSATDRTAVAAALRGGGFRSCGRELASFRDGTPTAVELVDATTLALPEAEVGALFAEATPLEGLVLVTEPAPHHVLLLLARKLGRRGVPSAAQRARVERALVRDPGAWDAAAARAAAWGAAAALARLRRLHRDGARTRTRRIHRPRRTRVLVVTARDAAAAAESADGLRDALRRLAFDVAVEPPRRAWRHAARGRVVLVPASARGGAPARWPALDAARPFDELAADAWEALRKA